MSMRKIKEILRLGLGCGVSYTQIGKILKISKTTAGDCLKRATQAGLVWPQAGELSDEELEARLYPQGVNRSNTSAIPDWSYVHLELKKKGVTRHLLWQEYQESNPGSSLGYSQYCDLYRQWQSKSRLSMSQNHKAGEKLFVDFAGKTVPITDPNTGEVRRAEIFVAVWGASNFTYVEAVDSQDIRSWLSAHVRALQYFGCCPRVIVPDNLRSAVSKACRYDPDLNPSYAELAEHYDLAIIPARVRKPKDKAKAELGVLIATRWILAVLRKRTFFSLSELNQAIQPLLNQLNDRPFQKLPGSRQSVFESLDKPAAASLPSSHYSYAEVRSAKVNIDYHIAVDDHFYSVPFKLRGEKVTVRLFDRTVEISHNNRRVHTHPRSYSKWKYTTTPEHMPEAHRKHLEWTPSRIINWAASVGEQTAKFCEQILNDCTHPEQGYRSCLGILRLAKRYGPQRVEAACKRAITYHIFRYSQVKSILERGLDRLVDDQPAETQPIIHSNIRGGDYYQIQLKGEQNADRIDNGEASGPAPSWNAEGVGGANEDNQRSPTEL